MAVLAKEKKSEIVFCEQCSPPQVVGIGYCVGQLQVTSGTMRPEHTIIQTHTKL